MPIGKIDAFDLGSKQWLVYVRRVNQYILLNEIKEELKVPLLITVVGEATYALMCDLCSPVDPEKKTFDELVKLVSEHLEPKRSEIAERHVFRLRRQRTGEPLMEYLQSLKHLASTCNFKSNLEENLRDQFVSGLASEVMRSRIFAETNIKYKEAVELALALEAAEKHAEVSGATAAPVTSAHGGGGGPEGLHYSSSRRGASARARRPPAGPRPPPAAASPAQQAQCWRCGKAHRADRCRYIHFNCDECNQRGHLKAMCKQVRGGNSGQSRDWHNYVSDDDSGEIFTMDIQGNNNKPYFIKVCVDGQLIECEIDTGSRISAINEEFYKKHFGNKLISTDNLILRSYAGSRIESLGYINVKVCLGDVEADNLCLYVIKHGSRPLLGRDWLRALKITQINLHKMTDNGFVSQLSTEFPEVFTDNLGTCKKAIRLQLTDNSPVYVRARPVPLALKARVEAELERLQATGSIYRVDHSDYGTPIVPVVKEDGRIRICGDYKITINPILKRDPYPLPRIDELFAALSGGERYTKIDLKHAFEQCILTEDCQPFTAITTHIGTFAYRRTPYGLSCIPEVFQKLMEETLRGVPGSVVFLDDICVTGANDKEHMCNLRAVLERLRDMGLTIKFSKCKFLQDSVRYLGFIIDQSGLRPDPTKLEAISSAPRPNDVTQLKSFLGMLNYYGKFIPNLSTILHPLHALLKKEVSWNWNPDCERAFNEAKSVLLSDCVLAHYEEGRPLVLSVDSSAYGLGGVLAHRYPDGSERPVSCVSRTLNAAEANYSQLDKEALAIFYGVTKHHQYLFGRKFVLKTDHQPLTYIFGKKGGIPQTAASRLQRWAVRLAAYDFTVEFVRSAENGPADALSRLPLPREGHCTDYSATYVNIVEESYPISFKQIAIETQKDKVLSRIYGYVKYGWPLTVSCDEEKPYFIRKDEIVVEVGCLIYKYRIIVPPKLHKQILDELHDGHLGMNKMKNLSRGYVYWPNLDRDIETLCRACEACRAVRDAPPHAPLHPWEFPLNPWQRLHADFAECGGTKYLIIVDAHSKWIEALPMKCTDAKSTINVFRSIFARFGLPTQLVTDNGPPFFSQEFKMYCEKNCIKHVTSAPYHPQGNGAAENAVKTVKKAIKRALFTGDDVNSALSKFLFNYRNCEHATTSVSPASALLGRRLRGRLDALRPDVASVVARAQERQVAAARGAPRSMQPGDVVLARDYTSKGGRWSEGRLIEKTGPVSYTVEMGDGALWRRHQDQILPTPNSKRFSLSRTSTNLEDGNSGSGEAGSSVVDVATGDIFEDASAGEGGPAASAARCSTHERPVSTVSESASPPAPPPLPSPSPPNASARALRAYNRAKNK